MTVTEAKRVLVLARFMSKLDVNEETECWVWIGPHNRTGYGLFKIGGERRLAHRVSWELHRGPIPDGLTIDHLCRNRECVNPEHLEPVTQVENNLRRPDPNGGGGGWARLQRAKTHCPAGHLYDELNTYHWGGGRYCKTCRSAKIRSPSQEATPPLDDGSKSESAAPTRRQAATSSDQRQSPQSLKDAVEGLRAGAEDAFDDLDPVDAYVLRCLAMVEDCVRGVISAGSGVPPKGVRS